MPMPKQKSEIVIKQFEDQIEDYTENALVEFSAVVPFLRKWTKKIKSPKNYSICEFGGGGGNLLQAIAQEIKIPAKLTNVELVGKYKKFQVDKQITFIKGSVLDSGFETNSYDVVIVRNVIHHLVADDLATTRANQMDAIRELIRVTKPGGLIIIEEQINNNLFSCLLFYYASRLATKLNIRIDRLQITPNTIVGYLTRQKLQWMCERHMDRAQWIEDSFEQWHLPWYWQITGLMQNTGEAFIVMQKR